MGIRSDTLLGAERGLKGTPYSHLVIHLSVYRISQTGHKTGREMYCSDTANPNNSGKNFCGKINKCWDYITWENIQNLKYFML